MSLGTILLNAALRVKALREVAAGSRPNSGSVSARDPVLLDDWHLVAWSHELPEGGVKGVTLLGEEIVLWRHEGQALAWRDLCLHRGTRLSLGRVTGGTLVCAYHGWRYGASGRCVHIPAHPDRPPPEKACVTTYACREEHGLIWVSLGRPPHEPLQLLEWSDPSFRLVPCGPYAFEASAPRVVENFLDVAHLPFVHDGLLGDSAHPELPDYPVETGPEGIVARDISIYQPDPDGTGKGARVTYTYCVPRPLWAHLRKDADGRVFSLFLGVCPVDTRRSASFMLIAMNHGHEIPLEQLQQFQDRIVAQDQPVVESQRPELLPLDLAAELHLRSDRTAIAYRQWLRQLGLTFGTA